MFVSINFLYGALLMVTKMGIIYMIYWSCLRTFLYAKCYASTFVRINFLYCALLMVAKMGHNLYDMLELWNYLLTLLNVNRYDTTFSLRFKPLTSLILLLFRK